MRRVDTYRFDILVREHIYTFHRTHPWLSRRTNTCHASRLVLQGLERRGNGYIGSRFPCKRDRILVLLELESSCSIANAISKSNNWRNKPSRKSFRTLSLAVKKNGPPPVIVEFLPFLSHTFLRNYHLPLLLFPLRFAQGAHPLLW